MHPQQAAGVDAVGLELATAIVFDEASRRNVDSGSTAGAHAMRGVEPGIDWPVISRWPAGAGRAVGGLAGAVSQRSHNPRGGARSPARQLVQRLRKPSYRIGKLARLLNAERRTGCFSWRGRRSWHADLGSAANTSTEHRRDGTPRPDGPASRATIFTTRFRSPPAVRARRGRPGTGQYPCEW